MPAKETLELSNTQVWRRGKTTPRLLHYLFRQLKGLTLTPNVIVGPLIQDSEAANRCSKLALNGQFKRAWRQALFVYCKLKSQCAIAQVNYRSSFC